MSMHRKEIEILMQIRRTGICADRTRTKPSRVTAEAKIETRRIIIWSQNKFENDELRR